MKNIKQILIPALLFVVVFIAGCHTFVLQPVEDQIKGKKWLRTPVEFDEADPATYKEYWEFRSDNKLMITREYAPDGTLKDTVTQGMQSSVGICYDYEYEIKLKKPQMIHILRTNIDEECPYQPSVEYWMFTYASNEEFYISSIEENSEGKTVKGGFQRGFVIDN